MALLGYFSKAKHLIKQVTSQLTASVSSSSNTGCLNYLCEGLSLSDHKDALCPSISSQSVIPLLASLPFQPNLDQC